MLLFICFLSGTALFYLFDYFPFSSSVLFVSASTYLVYKRKFVTIPVIAIGFFYAFLRFSPSPDPLDLWNNELRVTGRFVSKTATASNGNNIEIFTVDTAIDEESGEIEELRNEEINIFSAFEADYDNKYELFLKTGKDRKRLNPGSMNSKKVYGSIMAVNGSREAPYSIFNEFNRKRDSLNKYFLGRFNRDSAALIASVTTGETAYLGEDLRNAFNVTGLAHILSISGTHFGLFSIMLFGIFIFLIKRLPYKILQRLTIYLTPSQAAALLSIPFMVIYLVISGGSVPAIRSFLMISLFLAGLLLGRKGFWLNSLLFSACILVIWDPDVVLSLSFQLSFIAVLFIGFSVEKKEEDAEVKIKIKEEKSSRFAGYVKDSVVLTIAASAGTALLVAYYFHYISVISPLSNLIIAPLIGFMLIPLSLISSFSFLATGYYVFSPLVEISADLSITLVKLMAKIPYADLKIPAFPPALCLLFYAGFLFYLASGRKKMTLLVPFVPVLIYMIMGVFEKRDLSVTFIDVGQGDSAVIEFPDRKTVVVDTGRTGKETAELLRYIGKRDVEALILSHVHPDHTGGLEYLLERFNVKELWDNGRIKYPEDIGMNAAHKVLGRGDIIESGNYRIAVLHPYREFYTMSGDEYEEENNSSLVLKISGRKNSFIFPGDAGEEAEMDISHIEKWLKSDVIKMPHHGSRTSANDEFLSAVSPSVAVISVGRDNPFGHPSPEVLEILNRINIKILRTDLDGAVKVIETKNGIATKTYKEFAFEKADGISMEIRNIKRIFSSW